MGSNPIFSVNKNNLILNILKKSLFNIIIKECSLMVKRKASTFNFLVRI